MGKELHLFIIWQNGRYSQERILEDIRQRFSIYRIFDIQWSHEIVSNNFTRFYGTHLPKGCDKEKECGDGRFLLIVFYDNNPRYEYRPTSRGREIVNVNTFDSKQLYRSWAGGGSQVHGTNNTFETNQNLTMLLGCNVDDFCKRYEASEDICELDRDLEGANGWDSIPQLLYVLNNTGAYYVIMRGAKDLLQESFSEKHRDIDLLVSKYDDVQYIINGEPCCNEYRPHFKLTIKGYDYYFDLWDKDRAYYDVLWVERMFATRIKMNELYVLDEENNFYCLLYHCLIHKGSISSEYLPYLEAYRNNNPKIAKSQSWDVILLDYLQKNNYDITNPEDLSVHVNLKGEQYKQYACRYGKLRKQMLARLEDKVYYSKIYEKDDTFVKKGNAQTIENESRFLVALIDYDFSPKCIKQYEEGDEIHCIEISKIYGTEWSDFFGNKANHTMHNIQSSIKQIVDILRILQEHHIIHRDIHPSNLLVDKTSKGVRLGLIDFGWAIFEEEVQNSPNPASLGGIYRCPEGFNDAYSVSVLLRTTWPHIPFVKKIANELKKGNITEASSVKITMRDYMKVYLLRHRYIAKQVKQIKKKIKSLRIYKLIKRK